MEIRRLESEDAEELLRLRRLALEREPLAFAASPADDLGLDRAFVAEVLAGRLGSNVVLGAFDPGLVGMVGVVREGKVKLAHKALIWGLYVREGSRQRGAGAALVAAAIEVARGWEGVQRIMLGVTDRAPAALRLYERLGFVRWGTEPGAIRHGGEQADEHMLSLAL
jgi:RimJ/RimL family protein N-acetyltransferase